ncbi:hypothetical protein IFM89_015614 [Coptis chinensis]|uniref:protein-serine/threonine phosphatase n=1 Tax=Coptis chinensis TaxID=261450 RepID=A0A835I2H3_9MAGN|nr:hypothetical protein IFM89_015614 [Coptis chinensis]
MFRSTICTIRSGSYAYIGLRRYMEDEHIQIDDLSSYLGSICSCPTPSAFFGVFDGHGGPDAAAYMKENAIKIFFKDADFLQTIEADDVFLEAVENSIRCVFCELACNIDLCFVMLTCAFLLVSIPTKF